MAILNIVSLGKSYCNRIFDVSPKVAENDMMEPPTFLFRGEAAQKKLETLIESRKESNKISQQLP